MIVEMVSCDNSVPRVRARWCWMSRTVIPPAYSEMIMSSKPPARREPLGTSRGSKLPRRSRGTASGMSPTSLANVFGLLPLRELAEPRPAGSPSRSPDGRSARPATRVPAPPSPTRAAKPPFPVNANP